MNGEAGSAQTRTIARVDFTAPLFAAVTLLCAAAAVFLSGIAGGAHVTKLMYLSGAATWVAFWGLVTDHWVFPRGLRAVAVGSAAICLHYAGLRIDAVKLPFSTNFIDLGLWSLPVAALWLWLCSSLFARAGTIPGVAYGVGAVAWFTLALVSVQQPQASSPQILLLGVPLGIVCLALLLGQFNEVRGRTAGAYVLGFLVGAGSILGMLKNTAFLAAVLPLLLILVPLFGATYTYLAVFPYSSRRLALTQRRQHLHGFLVAQGYSPRQVAALLTLGAAWCGAVAVLLVALIEVHFALKTLVLLLFLTVGGLLGFIVLRILPREAAVPGRAIRLLGVRITPVTMDEALAQVREFIRDGTPHMIVTSDATGVVRAQEDAELREIMEGADLVTADGHGVVLAARLLNAPIRERVSGVDMVQRLCEVAAETGRSVFLLGGREGVAQAAADKLCSAVPGLQIAGVQHGYFGPEEEPEIIARIRQLRPGVLFVAFGIPRQEKWIRAHMAELGVPVCIGVGGSFDVISGRLKRAPVWMRRCGLEWLYRVCQEPWRLPRLKALPRIAWLALKAMLKGETVRYVE